jgi:hypothetical protein
VAPEAGRLPAEGVLRWVVPIGPTGLNHVVVEVAVDANSRAGEVFLRAYGKEGLLTHHPTKRLADEVWSELNR